MKLLHNKEVELSRELLATLPEGVEVIEGDGGYHVSAYPSVVVDVPAYSATTPVYIDGNFAGMGQMDFPAHEEVLRSPASWDAVISYIDFVTERANSTSNAS